MTDKALIVRCDDLLEADVNGEIVALHINKGQCYGMNNVASRIWAMLAEPITVAEICAKLGDQYDVDADTCHREVSVLLEDFRREGLIKPA